MKLYRLLLDELLGLLTTAAIVAAALVCAVGAVGVGAALGAALISPPGPHQLGLLLLAIVALRPSPPSPAPVAIDLPDDCFLFHLLVNCEVAR